jgi:hypothetical protein
MVLQSPLLSASRRLLEVSNGGQPVRPAPPADDVDAVRRLQRALRSLTGLAMPKTFVNGAAGEPDGKYGQETVDAVTVFQKKSFPSDPREWDGRVGQKTLAKMDALLPRGGGGALPVPPPLPPAPSTLTIVNQPAGNTLMLAEIDDAPAKADLNSAVRQLDSKSLGARLRVWFAKLGVGAAVLDEIEKQVLAVGKGQTPGARELLAALVASGKLETAIFREVTAGDLLAFPNVDLGTRLSSRSVTVNEGLLKNEMTVGGATALEMFKFWTTHAAVPAPKKNFATLDAAMATTPGFVAGAKQFEDMLRANIRAQAQKGLIDFRDLVTGPGPKRTADANVPPTEPGQQTQRPLPAVEPVIPSLDLRADTVAKICIGSFQGVHISMTGFTADGKTRQFRLQLRYDLRDHFGVDDDDCEVTVRGIHGTPGQVAMWVLQHYAPQGHKPFIDEVLVNRTVTGSF